MLKKFHNISEYFFLTSQQKSRNRFDRKETEISSTKFLYLVITLNE